MRPPRLHRQSPCRGYPQRRAQLLWYVPYHSPSPPTPVEFMFSPRPDRRRAPSLHYPNLRYRAVRVCAFPNARPISPAQLSPSSLPSMKWLPPLLDSASSNNLLELGVLSVLWLLWLVGCVVSTVRRSVLPFSCPSFPRSTLYVQVSPPAPPHPSCLCAPLPWHLILIPTHLFALSAC